jgi:hypothetical protein
MSDKSKQAKPGKLSSLPKPEPSAEVLDKLKGGGMRRGGDDDLKDLEVER